MKISTKIIALVLGLVCCTMIQAQKTIVDKSLRKECKKTQKLLKKGGWKVFASTQSLESVIESYYSQMEAAGDGVRLVIGQSQAANENMAQSKAVANAMNLSAGMIETDVRSATNQIISSSNEGKEIHSSRQFTSTTETSVRQTMKGMKPSMRIYRNIKDENGKPAVEMQLFYLVRQE